MKTTYIALALLYATFSLHAQSFYTGIQGGTQYNRILNKEDARAKESLSRLPSFSPVVGIPIGYRFRSQSGLRSIQAGVFYQGVNQICKGASDWSVPPRFDATLTLSYLHIPLELSIPLTNSASRFTPFISIGGFVNHLLYYKDHQQGYFREKGDMDIYRTMTGNRYKVQNGVVALDRTTDKWFYSRWLFGASAGLGGDIRLSDALALVVHARANYSLNDPEYKKDIKFYQDGKYVEQGSVFDGSTAKYFSQLPGVKNGKRPPSKLFNAGLQIGILYHFSKNLDESKSSYH